MKIYKLSSNLSYRDFFGIFVQWPYLDYQPAPSPFPELLLNIGWGFDTWRFYKTWSVIKSCGRWPLHVWGLGDLPRALARCPCCQACNVEVTHMFTECPASLSLYESWAMAAGYTVQPGLRLPWSVLRIDLFADRVAFVNTDTVDGEYRIKFVGAAVKLALDNWLEESLVVDIDALLHSAGCDVPLWGGE